VTSTTTDFRAARLRIPTGPDTRRNQPADLATTTQAAAAAGIPEHLIRQWHIEGRLRVWWPVGAVEPHWRLTHIDALADGWRQHQAAETEHPKPATVAPNLPPRPAQYLPNPSILAVVAAGRATRWQGHDMVVGNDHLLHPTDRLAAPARHGWIRLDHTGVWRLTPAGTRRHHATRKGPRHG
jgi:hypothetical protein